MMYQQFFGLTHEPLSKQTKVLWNNNQLEHLKTQFQWLTQFPGIGLLTGMSGTGKTSALRHVTEEINPHQNKIIYQSETHFTSYEIYCRLADYLGIEPHYRYSMLWRNIKNYLLDLVDNKHILPIWILDEAHNLPPDFLRHLPAFLNFMFDARDIITIWLVGLPNIISTLKKPIYSALISRIRVKFSWTPISNGEQFAELIQYALREAGCNKTILSDSAINLIFVASQGKIRSAHQILIHALRIASEKSTQYLSDDIIQQVIESLKL